MNLVPAAGALISLLIASLLARQHRARVAPLRLAALTASVPEGIQKTESPEIDWTTSRSPLVLFTDSLGRAGYVEKWERLRIKIAFASSVFGLGTISLLLALRTSQATTALLYGVAGLYLGAVLCSTYLRTRRTELQRDITFQMPLALEAIILLVESGLGILPAIERFVSVRENQSCTGAVGRYFQVVYQLAAHGMPFDQALAAVAERADHRIIRHVLLHLDISSSEGGELIPSLRSLSEHAHSEWKQSVETRVKRLENLVVFPVFVSVIGLGLLTAAGPLVPVLELKQKLEGQTLVPHRSVALAHQ